MRKRPMGKGDAASDKSTRVQYNKCYTRPGQAIPSDNNIHVHASPARCATYHLQAIMYSPPWPQQPLCALSLHLPEKLPAATLVPSLPTNHLPLPSSIADQNISATRMRYEQIERGAVELSNRMTYEVICCLIQCFPGLE